MVRNSKFFPRTELMDIVRNKLDQQGRTVEFRSFTLWGKPGIGKTQTALAYAHEQREQGVPQVFWISSELLIDMMRGFTQIALELKLHGAKPDAHQENKLLVLYWLRHTDIPWLLVFDNVENPEHLRACWPNATNGSVLVTARSSILAMDPAAGGIQVPPMTKDEGRDFIMKMIDRPQYSSAERQSAERLVDMVGGWPFALFQSSQCIRLAQKRINQYLRDCERDPETQHQAPPRFGIQNIYYPYSIENVFERSFNLLGKSAATLLEVVCFIAPIGIPDDIFGILDPNLLPDDLEFCARPRELDEAMAELLSTTLVEKDPSTFDMSVHRMTQELYRKSMGPERQYRCFITTARLLRHLFPKQEKGRSLRNQIDACRTYSGHVIALCDRARQFDFRAKAPGDFLDFTELAASCSWYLLEIGAWDEFWTIAQLASDVCEDRSSLVYADLCNSIGQLYCEQGKAAKGRPFMLQAKEIRERLLPPDHEDLADLYNNYANIIHVEWLNDQSLEEAHEWFKKALSIDLTKPEDERSQILHVRHLNLGTLFTSQGKWAEAEEQLLIGHKYAVQTFGPGKHWDATAEYKLANVAYFQAKWQDARPRFERALEIYEVSDKLHPTTTATQLKLATIAIKEGQVDHAIALLRKARLVCELNESRRGDKGDTARVVRRLSDALAAKGQIDEARALRLEAESYRASVQGSRYDSLPDSEHSYNLMVYKAFW